LDAKRKQILAIIHSFSQSVALVGRQVRDEKSIPTGEEDRKALSQTSTKLNVKKLSNIKKQNIFT